MAFLYALTSELKKRLPCIKLQRPPNLWGGARILSELRRKSGISAIYREMIGEPPSSKKS